MRLSAYGVSDVIGRQAFNLDYRRGRNFSTERTAEGVNVFAEAVNHVAKLRADGQRVLLAGWTEGSRERLTQVMEEHGLGSIKKQMEQVERSIPSSAALMLPITVL